MHANREEERVNTETVNTVAALRKAVDSESAHREQEDNRLLNSLQESMQKLQRQILENFGAA